MQTKLLRGWHPLFSLTLLFAFWKTILILIALASPGPGYDTSTSLLLPTKPTSHAAGSAQVAFGVSKFVRWDAIYYTQIAQRGHIFEQEWAFGRGLSSDLLSISRSQ